MIYHLINSLHFDFLYLRNIDHFVKEDCWVGHFLLDDASWHFNFCFNNIFESIFCFFVNSVCRQTKLQLSIIHITPVQELFLLLPFSLGRRLETGVIRITAERTLLTHGLLLVILDNLVQGTLCFSPYAFSEIQLTTVPSFSCRFIEFPISLVCFTSSSLILLDHRQKLAGVDDFWSDFHFEHVELLPGDKVLHGMHDRPRRWSVELDLSHSRLLLFIQFKNIGNDQNQKRGHKASPYSCDEDNDISSIGLGINVSISNRGECYCRQIRCRSKALDNWGLSLLFHSILHVGQLKDKQHDRQDQSWPHKQNGDESFRWIHQNHFQNVKSRLFDRMLLAYGLWIQIRKALFVFEYRQILKP